MKLSKHQREQHRGAARDLIQRIEGRLQPLQNLQGRRYGAGEGERIAQKVSACKERLRSDPKDRELLSLNMELADLFYMTSNAARGALRSKTHHARAY